MESITPFLWFKESAVEAMRFYTSVFRNSRIISSDASGGTFELDGRPYIAFNGGPHFELNAAFSLMVNCESQAEVDELWENLSAGGEKSRCGWLKDRFGLWWQVIPSALPRMLQDADKTRASRVRAAMLQMNKIDLQRLEEAFQGA